MAFRITDIEKQITAIIRKQSARILDEQAPIIEKQMEAAAGAWQVSVRQSLSVQVPQPWGPDTPRNLSQWPKRRTGKLQMSILRPNIQWAVRDENFKARRGTATLEFTARDFYGDIADFGYGDKLNTMRDFTPVEPYTDLGVKPFSGWKNRANSRLFTMLRIASSI